MSDPSAPTPTGHQRTTGGNFRWEPPTPEELQAMMPGYTIEKILGRGGMGAVYKGVQQNLDRTVAIKVLPPGVEKEDPSFAERFKSEAKLMAKLNHPAVVAVYDFGTTLGGQLYFAMEYVDGSDVSQMIRAQGKLPPEHALAITAHVCDALAAAHELGIVHRDIKPANVLLNMKGQVKVADFGLAKVEEPGQHGLTKTGYAMGTPDFVAPEVLMLGSSIDGRADLYAVGVMLYQMLTGEVPRGAFKPATARMPGLDRRYDPIIIKAMQSDREERYQSSAELRRDLDVILTVPLVKQDDPASAAIPVSQVAQMPAQRSAAQKPVGKPPQPRSADAPVRQPASPKAGEGTRAPAKSKTPLFIGLGIAAALVIGAIILFSGGNKPALNVVQASGLPVKAAGTAATPSTTPAKSAEPPKSEPKPVAAKSAPVTAATPPKAEPPKPAAPQATMPATVASTSPAPSVPSSPSPTVSQSSDKFPPGQWVTLYKPGSPTPTGHAWKDGWLVGAGGINLSVDPIIHGGIRVTMQEAKEFEVNGKFSLVLKARASSDESSYILRSNHATGTCQLEFLYDPSKADRSSGSTEAQYFKKMNLDEGAAPSRPITLELIAVGSKVIARLDGKLIASITDHRLKAGALRLAYWNPIRDIEVINLDGLPEAEALRILGVDEKGNDLRALAAKQEQQMAEQAKVVDAASAIPELKVLHEQFVKLTAERVSAPFEAEVAKLNAGYIGGIDRKITEEKAAGHLDGIIALEAEKKLIQGVTASSRQPSDGRQDAVAPCPIPAEDAEGTTPNLKALRAIYRAAHAKIETARVANLKQLTDPLTLRLKQLEADLTKKDRVPDAKTVREYREKLGEGSAITPDRSATPGGVAAKMNKAEKSLRAPVAIPKVTRSKPDPAKSRQAVEYALGKGCEVSIDHDDEIIPVKKIDDLPKSRWGLHRVKFLTPVTDEDLRAVTRAVELKEFLCSDRVGAGTFTSLAPLGNTPGLKILTLSRADGECSAEDAQALLQSAETLEQLNWLKLQRDDALLPVVTACRNLNYLYLLDTELTDDDVDQLRNLPVLRSLSFRGSKLTDAGARHLAKCNPLSRLTISEATESGATQLTPEGLAAITKAHGGTLIALGIGSHGSPHTEGMLRSIAADCSVLETLAIRGVTSPEALAGLSKLKKLKQLDFHRTSGKPIPLSVAHCQAISGIKSLETLGVSDCSLTGEHVQALAGLKSLKTLHLNRSPSITDASVPFLLSFQDLENLGLVNAGLTPAGILKLTAMKKLKTLTTTGINLTDAHIAQFKAALPGCTITR